MNFNEFAIKYLTDRGMFESQAAQVLDAVKETHFDMGNRWFDSINDYPDVMQAAIAVSLNSHAVDWIDKNLPKAFYRPIFAGEI